MPDIACRPMSTVPPSPPMTMMFGNGPLWRPLRIATLNAASMPDATAPPFVIWAWIQETAYGVHR
jgi:hypothetical protein